MAWAALGKKLATGMVKGKAKKIATDKLLNRKKKKEVKRPSLDELIAEIRGGGDEPSKGGELMVRPTTSLVPNPTGGIQKHTGNEGEYGSIEDNLIRIKSKTISIDQVLKGTLAAQKARKADQRKSEEQAAAAGAESKLEGKGKKKKGPGLKRLMPKVAISAWERLKNFFTNIVFGYVAIQLLPLLPTLLRFVKGLSDFIGWVTDIGLGLLTGLTTLIDWGYKLYDMGMGLVKNLVGEEGAEKLGEFMGVIKDLFTGFLVWKIIGKKIFEAVTKSITRAFRIAKVIVKRAIRFAKNFIKNAVNFAKNIASKVGKNLMKIPGVKNVVGKVAGFGKNLLGKGANILSKGKGLFSKGAGLFGKGAGAAKGVAGKVAGKAAGKVGGIAAKIFGKAAKFIAPAIKTAMPAVKGFLGRIPIMGPLIVGIVSLIAGDPPGKAIFKAFGAALGGALGTFIPIPVIGTLIGETIGVFVGELLYYLIIKRDPKAAFKFLKDSFMKIFNVGKNIFLFFKEGFGRFINTFPMVKFPAKSIGTMVADFLSINPIYKKLLEWEVPGWKVIPKAIRGFSLGKMLDTLPSIPEILGKIFSLHPLLKKLVKDGKVEGFPAIWQLMNPAFMINHLKESFFPSKGGAGSPQVSAVSGGGGKVGGGKKKEDKEDKEAKKKEAQIEKEKKMAEMKEKIGDVAGKVGGFFKNIGKGIKNIGGKIIKKHPAVMAAKAVKNAVSPPCKCDLTPVDVDAVSKKTDDISTFASYEQGAEEEIVIPIPSASNELPQDKVAENNLILVAASGSADSTFDSLYIR